MSMAAEPFVGIAADVVRWWFGVVGSIHRH